MNPLAIFWLWRIGGVLVLTGLITAGYFGWRSHERGIGAAPYIQQIKDNNDAAAAKLAELTAKADAATRALKDFATQQEISDHANTQTITALNLKLRAIRLRDPGQTGRCSGGTQSASPASAADSATDPSQGSGLLSIEASKFLWDFALSADQINAAYRSCRAYAQAVRAQLAIADAAPLVLAMSDWAR